MRVLVIEDHPLYRRTLCEFLATLPDVELCAFATDGLIGLELAEKVSPDVVIVDLQVSGLNGFDLCERLTKTQGSAWTTVVYCEETVRFHERHRPPGVDHLIPKEEVFEQLPAILAERG